MTCTLCSQDLSGNSIFEGENGFCCPGCHVVFNILSSKNQLQNFQENPVFQQALQSGLISNPALLEQIKRNQPKMPDHEMEKLHLTIDDMWCPSCAEIIRLVLLQMKGIRNCVVDYATDLASVEFAPRYLSKENIFAQIGSLGYQAQALQDSQKKAVSASLYFRFAIAAFCSLNVMMFSYPLYATYFHEETEGYGALFAWLSFFASLPVLFYCALPILRRFMVSLQMGLFGMETLVVLGVGSAFGLSTYELFTGGTKVYFDSMTVIIVFMLLGKIIEARAKFSAKDSLLRLAMALPRRGRKRFSDNTQAYVPLKEIVIGDILIACTGEKIVLDGEVVEGEGACDESLMTGESIPVKKGIGDLVLGGTLLQQGWIAFRVRSSPQESALYKIIEMVQQDIGHKTVYVRSADQIVKWFVPAILLIALMTAFGCWMYGISDDNKSLFETAVIRAVSILLISCPCAIGIAAPLAESHLMNSLANLGVIVRNRGSLSLIGREDIFIFDKTGTITEGRFAVLDGLSSLSRDYKSLLKGLASQSIHPISSAISQAIDEPAACLSRHEEMAGHGLKGMSGEDLYYLGSANFLRQNGIEIVEPILKTEEVVSIAYFAHNDSQVATLILGDRIRQGAQEVIAKLSPKKTFLLSGDAQLAVETVSRICGFDAFQWGCTPFQKKELVSQLRRKGEIVCMFGDGINDAPALTEANIGISMVSAADISIQVSDILLTTDHLQVINKIHTLARKGQRIIKQNLFWAFFYNVLGIGLAAYGILSPIFAAFAMVVSSLLVLFNAKRI